VNSTPDKSLQAPPIVALASGSGAAAIGILRVSGADCHALVRRCIKLKSAVITPKPRHLYLCEFTGAGSGQTIIDEPMVVFFSAPASFTGEDSVEIYCHGGPYIIQKILAGLFACGIRQAQPGEFTKRAYLNGKMDLTEAEGIRQLVAAQSHQQWLAARQLATGSLGRKIETLRRELVAAMAHLEARIDFPDEGDTANVERADVGLRVRRVYDLINTLLATFQDGRVAANGLVVALIGTPNVGKSTLLNTLLGKERAIVTDIEGTTRDYIEESCLVNGRLVRLVDTAGIRETAEKVEQLGVQSSLRQLAEADLILFLSGADSSPARRQVLEALVEKFSGKAFIKVMTKADLGCPDWATAGWMKVSCLGATGVDELRDEICRHVDQHIDGLQEQIFITSVRHAHALERARTALAGFFQADELGQYEECLAFELQEAARALQSIIGDVQADDLLEEVFTTFCVGK